MSFTHTTALTREELADELASHVPGTVQVIACVEVQIIKTDYMLVYINDDGTPRIADTFRHPDDARREGLVLKAKISAAINKGRMVA